MTYRKGLGFTRRAFVGGSLGLASSAAVPSRTKSRARFRVISCEEGFLTPEVLAENERLGDIGIPLIRRTGPTAALAAALADIGPGRIAAMDAAGVDMQLLLLSSPGVQVFETNRAAAIAATSNDRVAEACRRYPDRFAALAAIAPQDPPRAARELERAVTKLGLRGVVINSHTNDEYLDAQKFWPILEAAEALRVPIYIHPREPSSPMRRVMEGPTVQGAMWAYAVETGTHAMRLIGGGVFDRFPHLQVVLGHMGEALPFWLPRIDNRYLEGYRGGRPRPLKRLPGEYIREHFHVTSSGMNYAPQVRMAQEVMGRARVLFAVDYPFEDQVETVRNARELPFGSAEARAFFETNASRLFRLAGSTTPRLKSRREG